MLKSLQRHISLWVKSRTGLSSGFLVGWAVAGVATAMVFIFLCVAGYAWLSVELGPVYAGLAMAGAFLLMAAISVAASSLSQRQTKERALLQRAARARAPWALADPVVLNVVMQAGRALGWQRIVPMALLGFLATQWSQAAVRRRQMPDGRLRTPNAPRRV